MMKEQFIAVDRKRFLAARHAVTEESKKNDVQKDGFSRITVDAGDEVLCDFCNADVEEDPIYLNERGTYLVCKDCREK